MPPRYGADVVGGAELGCRLLAEHLAGAGVDVQVVTTCARSALTWADEHPPGTTVEGGVPVTRLRSRAGRTGDFDDWGRPLLAAPEAASTADAEEWLRRQGPWCPTVVEAALDSGADRIAYYPYLYYPTTEGVRRDPGRAVLHAAAHDEAPLRLGVFDEVFGSAAGLVFHTRGERDLVARRFAVGHVPQVVLGLGIDEVAPPVTDGVREHLGLGGAPFLLCLGRVDPGKGTDLLVRLFAAYKQRRPGPLRLVVTGPVNVAPPTHPDVAVTGPVDEDTKAGLLTGATALVNPSANESFSFVVLEAMDRGTPVLVNARCAATTGHAVASGAGLTFGRYGHFEVALDRLLAEPGLRRSLGQRGREYVAAQFRWPVVVDRYLRFLDTLPAGRA